MTFFPAPNGHFEWRIDRLDPRPPRVRRESLPFRRRRSR
jgi:hypothetical protein